MSLKKERKKFRQLKGKQKLQYIWDYYKFPMAVVCILIYILGYTLYGHITKKEILLHTALINVSIGEDLTKKLTDDFLNSCGIDLSENDLLFTTGLYLTTDPSNPDIQYSQASQLKLLANIDAENLDIVIMDEEAFHTLAEKDYFYDLSSLLSEDCNPKAYAAVTKEAPVGIDLSSSSIIAEAGFQDEIYLGVIKNSPHLDMAEKYIEFLFS